MPESITQIKFTLSADIVTTFRVRCAKAGVSMTSVIREWMQTGKPVKNLNSRTITRHLRKKTVLEVVDLLNEVLLMEEQYRDAIPEQFALRYEAADHACGQLAEAITCLEEAFS